MKNYFPHDHHARTDKKITTLIMKKGLEGYGLYWCIVEMLYEENGWLMRSHCDVIAYELRTDCATVLSLIDDFGLFVTEGEKFTSLSVLRRLEVIQNKSIKASQSAQSRWKNANALQPHNEGNAIKEKESKIKESKEVVINISFDSFWNLYDKKVGELKKVKSKWQNLNDADRLEIMDYIPKYIQAQPEKRYRKNPETFLNNRSWKDEIIFETQIKPLINATHQPLHAGSNNKQAGAMQLLASLKEQLGAG